MPAQVGLCVCIRVTINIIRPPSHSGRNNCIIALFEDIHGYAGKKRCVLISAGWVGGFRLSCQSFSPPNALDFCLLRVCVEAGETGDVLNQFVLIKSQRK